MRLATACAAALLCLAVPFTGAARADETVPAPGSAASAPESSIGAPPAGFAWKRYRDVVFLKPQDWKERGLVQSMPGISLLTYATSPEEFSHTRQFETGFTISIATGMKAQGFEPRGFASVFVAPDLRSHPKEDLLLLDRRVSGDKELTFFRFRDAPPGKTPIVVHRFIVANDRADSVHVFTFESPESSWQDHWSRFGTPILARLRMVVDTKVP